MSAEVDDAAASRRTISLCVVSLVGEVVLREVHVKLNDFTCTVDAAILAAFEEGQSGHGCSAIRLTSPAGDLLSKGSTFEACGIKDGDCLTAVVQRLGFCDGVHLSNSTTYLAVSEDGDIVTKKDGPFSEASVRMAVPIDRNLLFFVTTRATHNSGGHIQIGFATEGGFLKGGLDRAYQRRPTSTDVWGFDTGGSGDHQFGTTHAEMKQPVAASVCICAKETTKDITLAVQGSDLWMAVGDEVIGKIADGLPADEHLYAFVLAEPATGVVVELLPTPTTVEIALRNAVGTI